jgi:tetratricopeptide (TPR) repeat protein
VRQIALANYLNRIGGLIEEQRLPEAAAHCHFILQQHPQHLETYRLFGRVLLEQQLHDDAIDIFRRVLGVDPEDLMAHAGLSVAFKEKLDLPQAIWHMERAFELKPYDKAIRQELTEMYASRDGFMRQKLGLTEAALARLHFRGALFELAASELRELVARFPERVDLMILLAKALFWNGNRVESVRVCHELLNSLPFCLEANAILANVLQSSGRDALARPYLERLNSLTLLTVRELDENSIVGQTFAQSTEITVAESIFIEELNDAALVAVGPSGDIDWSDSEAGTLDEVPSWLDELSFEPPDDVSLMEQQPVADEDTPTFLDSSKAQGEKDESDQSGQEEFPAIDPEQLESELFNMADDAEGMEAAEDWGIDKDWLNSDPEDWSWEDSDAIEGGTFAPVLEESDGSGSPGETPSDLSAAGSTQLPEEYSSDDLWADAMDELSRTVSDDAANNNQDVAPAIKENDEEDLASNGWYDEIAEERDVTGELPGWLQNSVEATQENDSQFPQNIDQLLDELPEESGETVESDSNDSTSAKETLQSSGQILTADNSINDISDEEISSPNSLLEDLSGNLADGEAEPQFQSDHSLDDITEDWLSHPPGESAIWLDEIAAENQFDPNRDDLELDKPDPGQKLANGEDEADDHEAKG